jgi:phage terminase large subunit-like protein
MRTNESVFTKAAELCQDEILEGKFTHDGDPRLARHVANARERPNRYGTSVRKETPDSPKKIDGAVCVIGARHVRKLVAARHGDKSGRAMAV